MNRKPEMNNYCCRVCKKYYMAVKEDKDMLCLECKNLEMRLIYEKERVSYLTEVQLKLENKKLKEKLRNIEHAEYDYDSISEEDRGDDGDYIPETPTKKNTKRFKSVYQTSKMSSPVVFKEIPLENIVDQVFDDKGGSQLLIRESSDSENS